MIIYFFNHYFPHESGFGRRCEKEIKALAQTDEIVVICRRNVTDSNLELNQQKNIKLIYYDGSHKVVHQPKGYRNSGLYELQRNFELSTGLLKQLFIVIVKNKHKHIKLYSVTSPLTVPFLGLLISVLLRVRAKTVAFHDLEPELAVHLKNISKKNWLYRLELFLEKLVCNWYEDVIVTSKGQSDVLMSRTQIPSSKIFILPNSSELSSNNKKHIQKYNHQYKNTFILLYMSTLSFNYTVNGLLHILDLVSQYKLEFAKMKILIVGGGESYEKVKKLVQQKHMNKMVDLIGHVSDPVPYLKVTSAAIIPWLETEMTKTMLPTKLFEYLSNNIAVIAPKFGQFEHVLTDGVNAFLYDTDHKFIDCLRDCYSNPAKRAKISSSGFKLYEQIYKSEKLMNDFKNFYLRNENT